MARAGPGPHRPGPHRRAPVRPSATLAQAPAPTAAAAKRVPRMPGQLPFFGAVPKVDIRKVRRATDLPASMKRASSRKPGAVRA